MPYLRHCIAAAVLLAAAATACNSGEPASVDTDVPAFDGDSAYALLARQVAFGPRAPGSEGHRQQLAWMLEFLGARADTVLTQPFVHLAGGDTIRMTNVFARFRPELAERILVVAHWDTRPVADQDPDPERRDEPILGANDGASGTAVLLQLANVLSRHSPPIGVDLLFTDGEDYAPGAMYLGAKHFAANQPAGYRPFYGVLLDMVGDVSPRFPIEGNSRDLAPEVVDRVYDVAHEIGYGGMFPREVEGYVSDDHLPLNEGGIRTIDIIDFEYGPNHSYWHTHQDVLANTGPRGLQATGDVVTHLIFRGG